MVVWAAFVVWLLVLVCLFYLDIVDDGDRRVCMALYVFYGSAVFVFVAIVLLLLIFLLL